jgi:hypothetical protein
MKYVVFVLTGFVACSFVACGDDVTRVGDNTGGSSGVIGQGGSAAQSGAPNDLSGVWSITGSLASSGAFATGTLTIGAHQLALAMNGGGTLAFSDDGAAPILTWTDPNQAQLTSIQVAHTGAPADLGAIPLELGGQWQFSNPPEPGACTATLQTGSFSASCSDVSGEPAGFPSLNSQLSATRTSALPSLFGELGGSWQIASNGGATGGCNLTLMDNQLTASCSGTASPLDGTLSFTLEGNVGSGSTNWGLEISAVRQ